MKKTKLHFYLGTNGTLLTPINIVGAQGVIKYRLEADSDKVLTKDGIDFCKATVVPEDELELWSEVSQGQ